MNRKQKSLPKFPKSILSVFSWCLYDFANTIYSINIISLYLPLWITIDKGKQDILYAIPLSISMLLVAMLVPLLGVISDRHGRKMPFLIVFTAICVIFTALMGCSSNILVVLTFFLIANVGYQASLTFYNALLPEVSTRGSVGKISGFGVSLGYVGTIFGLFIVKPFLTFGGRQETFIPTSVVFFIFALPCFLFVKETRVRKRIEIKFRSAFKNIIRTLQDTKSYPGLLVFLLGSFILLNSVNTIIIFMSVYAKKVILFSDEEIFRFLITSTVFAIFGSLFYGFVTDLIGPKKALSAVILSWVLAISLAILSFNKKIFWVVGPMAGISLGSTWVSARALVVNLSPSGKTGEFFGLFGLMGKSACVVGPMIWGISLWVLSKLGFGVVRYRFTASIFLCLTILSFFIIQKVKTDEDKNLRKHL